jgi:hypothetical protein
MELAAQELDELYGAQRPYFRHWMHVWAEHLRQDIKSLRLLAEVQEEVVA